MQQNYKSRRLSCGRHDPSPMELTQAQHIAAQIALERELSKAQKNRERPRPSLRKFSWEGQA